MSKVLQTPPSVKRRPRGPARMTEAERAVVEYVQSLPPVWGDVVAKLAGLAPRTRVEVVSGKPVSSRTARALAYGLELLRQGPPGVA